MPELPSAPALNAPLWVIFCHLILSRMLNSSAPQSSSSASTFSPSLISSPSKRNTRPTHYPTSFATSPFYPFPPSIYLSALLANLVKVHRSRYRASNLRHPPSNPRWRNNRPVPRVTRMTQPRFFFAGFSASALLFLPPRSPLSLPFPRSSSWLRFFRVFFLLSLPLVLERVFSFFLHCCPPPLSFVARAARPIARNGLTVFVDDTKKGRGGGSRPLLRPSEPCN